MQRESVHRFLIAISKSPHAGHHAKHIIIRRKHVHRRGGHRTHCVVGHGQQESRVINARQVAGAAGLVLLGLESKGVDVDAHCRDVGVVLVGLYLVEVTSLAHLEAVVAVELEQGCHYRVLARHTLHTGHGVARLEHGAVPPVGEVERLLTLPRVHVTVVTRDIRVTLHNPDELLAGVVEVQLELVGGGGDGLYAGKLQGLDQVLVRHLRKLAALVRVQVEVIHIQRRRHQVRVIHTVAHGVYVGLLRSDVPAQVAELVELQVHAHLVVLQRNEGQRQARIAAEPELERDVESVLRRALAHLVRRIGLARRAEVVAVLTALHQQIC